MFFYLTIGNIICIKTGGLKPYASPSETLHLPPNSHPGLPELMITKLNLPASTRLCFQLCTMMSCFPVKVMATVVAVFLLVGGIHIPPTSASLPYGNISPLFLSNYIYINNIISHVL
jgi:hypothetical protein